MYDERFDRDNAYLQRLMERRHQAASWIQATANESQLAALQDVVTAWWHGHYASYVASPEKERAARAGEELGGRLYQNEGISVDLRRAFEKYFAARRHDSTFEMAAAILLGRTLGVAVARVLGEDVSTFDGAVQLIADTFGEGLSDFVDAFTGELAGQPGLTQAWLAKLTQMPDSLGDLVEVIGRQEQAIASLDRQQQEFCAAGNPFRLWREIQGDLPVEITTYARFLILSKIDFKRFIDVVGGIPSNEVRQSIIEVVNIPKDKESILQGVQMSPCVALAPAQGNLVALHMLAAGVDYVVRLNAGFATAARFARDEASQGRLAEEMARFQGTEAPVWLRRLFTVLLARPDGTTIALEYARYLISLAQRATASEWNPYVAALQAVTEMIEETSLDAQFVHNHWCKHYPNYSANHTPLLSRAGKRSGMQRAHDDSPVPYIIIAASLDNLRPPVEAGQGLDGATAMVSWLDPWRWYVDILVHGDDDISNHVNPFGGAASWVFATIAQSLVKHEESVQMWVEAWHTIAFQRQFERFGFNVHDSLAPSLHLLQTGRCSVALLAQDGHHDRARTLWGHLLKTSYQVSFGGTGTQGIVPANEIGVLFASVRLAFGEQWQEALETAAPIFTTHGDIAIMAAQLLIESGIAPGEVAKAFTRVGCNLGEECATLARWQELGGFGRRDAENLPISKLAESLMRS